MESFECGWCMPASARMPMCCWSAAAPAVRLRSVGWPAAVRQGFLSTDLCLLLRVDSDEAAGMMLGDVGRLYLWINRDDLAARRFDRATLEFQAH